MTTPITTPAPRTAPPDADAPGLHAQPGGFRLMRYFTLTTLVAFVAVGAALVILQRMEERFFDQVQREQAAFISRAQGELARQQLDAARSSLMAVHEAGHLNLTRLVANLMWESDFGPFVAAAQRFPVEPCRALEGGAGAAAASSPRRSCFAELGRRLKALPGFKAMDARAYAAMRASTVFKVKVFDLRGITVYSSEHAQIGEDAQQNAGWRAAAGGRHASELTHRDRFSAFERVVENRDLISTYVPIHGADGRVVGVLEIYSDVTPFLDQIKEASHRFADIAVGNEARIKRTAQANQALVVTSSDHFLLIVGGLLLLLYAVSLAIVRYGQRIIDRQTLAQAQAARREQQWHREKMAALSAMAANVSHEVGNPLAIISGLVEDLAARDPAAEPVAGHSKMILEQTARIAAMMRQISEFAAAPADDVQWVDVNAAVKSVCDFLNFGRAFRAAPIVFAPAAGLPARRLVPDHLNEVVMSLLQAGVDDAAAPAPLRVETAVQGNDVQIRIGGEGDPAAATQALRQVRDDPRYEAARRRVAGMGGRLTATASAIEITLPPPAADAAPA